MSTKKDGIELEFNKLYSLRDAVGEATVSIGEKNDRICIVSANVMGSCKVSKSIEKFPERSFNVGISEQEMVSFSAGLAKEGLIPYAFAMGPFFCMRACEQIRTSVAYNNFPVRMIGTYAGVSGGISGATHWAIEDCSIIRGMPEITLLEPSDPLQAKKMIEATVNYDRPVYIRVGIVPTPAIYGDSYEYRIGKADFLIEGSDGAFIASGLMVRFALLASKKLYEDLGYKIKVIDMHTIKPIDRDAVLSAAGTSNIVVVQDHNIVGGLGDAVARVLVEEEKRVKFKVVGIPDRFIPMGHAPFLYNKYKMDEEGLYFCMKEMLSTKQR